MADFDFDFPDNFLSELLETDFDELAEDMLTEAAPIYKDAIKKSMKSTIMHEGESEMVESVTARKPKKCKKSSRRLRQQVTQEPQARTEKALPLHLS